MITRAPCPSSVAGIDVEQRPYILDTNVSSLCRYGQPGMCCPHHMYDRSYSGQASSTDRSSNVLRLVRHRLYEGGRCSRMKYYYTHDPASVVVVRRVFPIRHDAPISCFRSTICAHTPSGLPLQSRPNICLLRRSSVRFVRVASPHYTIHYGGDSYHF